MNELAEIRRENLRAIIDRNGLAASARRFQKPDRQLNDMLAGRKAFGEKIARVMERNYDPSLPPGWLDIAPADLCLSSNGSVPAAAADLEASPTGADMPRNVLAFRAPADLPVEGYVRLEHLSARPQMGAGAHLAEPVQVVRHIDVLERWVRDEVGTLNPQRVKVLTAVGRSMVPTINDRDLVFVDVGHRHFDAPGLYVIDVGGRLLLKKVMMLADGTVVIRSDNTAEFPDEERYPIEQATDTITVCGKVLAWWTLHKG